MSIAGAESLGFGDELALARRAWIIEAGRRLEREGFPGYRRSDAFIMRRLQRASSSLGALGEELTMSRQGARKVVDTLVERGFVLLEADPADARKSRVVLSKKGTNYARAIVGAIASMNKELLEGVGEDDFDSAMRVLGQIRRDFPTSAHGTISPRAGSRNATHQRRSIRSM